MTALLQSAQQSLFDDTKDMKQSIFVIEGQADKDKEMEHKG